MTESQFKLLLPFAFYYIFHYVNIALTFSDIIKTCVKFQRLNTRKKNIFEFESSLNAKQAAKLKVVNIAQLQTFFNCYETLE